MMKKFFILSLILFFSVNNYANSSVINENEIFKNLRCLVCQGQSIADSNSDFAQNIKIYVRDLIKEGKSEYEINEYLVSKYGSWILYKPAFNKINFVLWLFPYLFLAVGGIYIFLIIRNRKKN